MQLAEVGHVDHRIAAKLGVIGHNDNALRAFHHCANRFDDEGTAVAQTSLRDAPNTNDGKIGRDALKHAFADGTQLNAQPRIHVTARQRYLRLPAIPENLGDRNRVCNDLDRAINKSARHLGNGGTTAKYYRLPVLDQVSRNHTDPVLFFLATDGEKLEIKSILSRGCRDGPPMNSTDCPGRLKVNH